MRIACLSDTHCLHNKIVMPDADVLVHAGDSCRWGTLQELESFCTWLSNLHQYNYVICVAGNHDWPFAREDERHKAVSMLAQAGAIYLQDSVAMVEGKWFHGSPWQPEFCNWAFNLPRGKELADKWANIPDTVDVLVTHGPPFEIGDFVHNENIGCRDLRHRVNRLSSMKAHIFGHCHAGAGRHTFMGKQFVNAAICTERYLPENRPIVIDI
jgi:Icc-related predicted phosphoesterase